MTTFDLQIREDKLDEFEVWFASAHPTSSRNVVSFKSAREGGVVYTVRVSCRSLHAASSTRERWAPALRSGSEAAA